MANIVVHGDKYGVGFEGWYGKCGCCGCEFILEKDSIINFRGISVDNLPNGGSTRGRNGRVLTYGTGTEFLLQAFMACPECGYANTPVSPLPFKNTQTK